MHDTVLVPVKDLATKKRLQMTYGEEDGEEQPPKFDFSQAQWNEIATAIAAVRSSTLTKEERESLCYSADEFLADFDARRKGTYVSPKKRAEAWKRVAKLSCELRDAIEIAGQLRWRSGWKDEPITAGQYLGEFIDMLDELEFEFTRRSDPSWWIVSIEHSATGRLDPSVVFQQRILYMWTDQFGGSLTVTKDPNSGKISGPLATYFFAVARPVMGNRTPSPQSLPDIVSRQKRFHEVLKKQQLGNTEV
jgi:hypothetical protein